MQALDFSRDGTRLAILTGVPDFRLIIWDLTTGAPLCEASSENAPPHLVKFNPLNDRQLVTISTSFVHFWSVDSILDRFELSKRCAPLRRWFYFFAWLTPMPPSSQ